MGFSRAKASQPSMLGESGALPPCAPHAQTPGFPLRRKTSAPEHAKPLPFSTTPTCRKCLPTRSGGPVAPYAFRTCAPRRLPWKSFGAKTRQRPKPASYRRTVDRLFILTVVSVGRHRFQTPALPQTSEMAVRSVNRGVLRGESNFSPLLGATREGGQTSTIDFMATSIHNAHRSPYE